MHTANVETLKTECLRLIDVELELLSEIEKEVVKKQSSRRKNAKDSNQEISLESINTWREIFNGEKEKLENMEMVLAVVGTMKAGKSTSINAIVGKEILPNRNKPMTALPTLIRHTRGCREPILKFNNNQPVLKLYKNVLKEQHKAGQSFLNQEALAHLIKMQGEAEPFGKEYRGAEQIFEFLRSLNDLARVATELGLQFPFDSYDEISEMPVIEVEFCHLQEIDDAKGRLTLLDTPGPNEAGQAHLKAMLKDQLRKASGVIAVLDYTQLGSEADADVRSQLLEIIDVCDNRLHILVNKFDETDRNSLTEDEVKNQVSSLLLNGEVDADSVYPVSSKQAYLANRARTELAESGQLPNAQSQRWVEDFGKEAFGRKWEKSCQDVDEVVGGIDELWAASKFSLPLENVIKSSYRRAVFLSLQSAASIATECAETFSDALGAREGGLRSDLETVKAHIQALQEDVQRLAEIHKLAENKIKHVSGDFAHKISAIADAVSRSTTAELGQIFTKQKQKSEDAIKNKRLNEGKRLVEPSDFNDEQDHDDVFGKLFGTLKRLARDKDNYKRTDKPFVDASKTMIQFDSAEEAQRCFSDIMKFVNTTIKKANSELGSQLNIGLKGFNTNFDNEVASEVKSLLTKIKGRFEKSGIDVNLNLSPIALPKIKLSDLGSDIFAAEEKKETKTYTRVKDNVLWKVINWVNDDWGLESYSEEETFYVINPKQMQTTLLARISSLFTELAADAKKEVITPIEQASGHYFEKVGKLVEGLRGELLQSIEDKSLDKKELEDLSKALGNLKNTSKAIANDCNGLKEDCRALDNCESQA